MKSLTYFDKVVRDYLWDNSPNHGVSSNTILNDVNLIRGATTSLGAVNRSLRKLIDAGMVERNDTARPATFHWNQNSPKPSDYTPRPLPFAPRGNMMTTPQTAPAPATPGTPMTDDEKREELRIRLEARMAEIKGEKQAKEEELIIPTAKKDGREPLPRPNGIYMEREIAGMPSVEYIRQLREEFICALLEGPPGTGKTAWVEAAFWDQPGGLHTVTADENTNVDDFLGQWSPTGNPSNPYVWVDGPLILAMKKGGVLFIDDATLANPKVLAVNYPAMDGRGKVIVKSHIVNGKPEEVTAQKGFYVIAAHNPGVHGAILTDALSSRFRAHIHVKTDLQLAASLGVGERFITLVKKLSVEAENGQIGIWIPQLRELLTARDMSQAFDEKVAAANLLGSTPEEDQDVMADKMRIVWKEDISKLELGDQL